MIFNSFSYLIFLGIIAALYWYLPRTPRLWLLLIASLVFYGFWNYLFIAILLFSVGFDYFAALWIASLRDERMRKMVLVASLAVNLGILGFFKYAIFVLGQVEGFARLLGLEISGFSLPFHVILPIGISFYTFHSMSYTIDVWRRRIEPKRNFILFATFVVFFPQLVAGPILRAAEVIPQLDQRPQFQWADVAEGIRRLSVGLAMKVLLADNIARLVNRGFELSPSLLGGVDVLTLAFLFGFQIYFDFAGYSHIAVGSARILGIRFPENFNFPYMAVNPQDFWRRWHISLSSWIRDYLYLPLAGATSGDRSQGGLAVAMPGDAQTQAGPGRRFRALWITWFIMGLWHGANWTFVFWGLWHAAIITIYRLCSALKAPRLPVLGAWAITLPAMMLGWIFFRATSVHEAFALYGRFFNPGAWLSPPEHGAGLPLWMALDRDCYYSSAAILCLIVLTWIYVRWIASWLDARPGLRLATDAATAAVVVPLIFLFLQPVEQFIYFQF